MKIANYLKASRSTRVSLAEALVAGRAGEAYFASLALDQLSAMVRRGEVRD